jgi:hypothetical protein
MGLLRETGSEPRWRRYGEQRRQHESFIPLSFSIPILFFCFGFYSSSFIIIKLAYNPRKAWYINTKTMYHLEGKKKKKDLKKIIKHTLKHIKKKKTHV